MREVEVVVVEKFEVGDTVKIEGVVTKVHSDGSVNVDTPAGRRRYFVAEDVMLIKKAPEPEPIEPTLDFSIVKLTDEHGVVRVAVRRQGFSSRRGEYAWLVSGYPGAYSWKTMLDRFGRKDAREVTAATPLRTKLPAPEEYHPFAYIDECENVHYRDALCPHLYHLEADPEQKLTVEELAREVGNLKALHLEGERP